MKHLIIWGIMFLLTACSNSSALPTLVELPTEILTPTASSTLTPTSTITNTPTRTFTPLPTATQSRTELVLQASNSVSGLEVIRAEYNELSNTVIVEYEILLNDRSNAEFQMGMLLCAIRVAGFTEQSYQFIGKASGRDAFGNSLQLNGIIVRMGSVNINLINCENDGLGINWDVASESYFADDGLRP